MSLHLTQQKALINAALNAYNRYIIKLTFTTFS
jgi:hypothetical protein